MAGIRDPQFWKRFSMAVHQNDSKYNVGARDSPDSVPLQQNDTWLEAQQRKKSGRVWWCVVFWTGFLLLIAGAVVTFLVLEKRKGTQAKR